MIAQPGISQGADAFQTGNFLLEEPQLLVVQRHIYAYTGKLDVIIDGTAPSSITHETIPNKVYVYTPTVEPLIVDLSSKTSYVNFLQRVRYAEDEALILGEEFSDLELINKVKTSAYFNKYSPELEAKIAISFNSEISGTNSWIDKLMKDDEEFLFSDFID